MLFEKAPYLLMALPFAVLGAIGQRLALGPPALDLIPRLLLGTWRFVFYLCKTIFPAGLSPVYDSGAPGAAAGGLLPLAAALAVLGATAALWRWGKPWALASWLWYSILVLPVLGVFSFAPQATADRYTYLSCLPWALLAAAGIAHLAERARLSGPALAGLLASVALLAGSLFFATRLQLEYWRDSESLWRRAVATTPDSVIARNNLGDLLLARNDLQGAWDQYKRAFDLDPAHVPTNYKLGRVYQSAGMQDAAAMCYERAARLDPTFLPAWSSLGVLLFSMKRPDEAVDILRESLAQKVDERRPGARELRASLMNNLGNVLFESGRQMEALKEYARAIRYEPRDPSGHHNAGAVWELLGQREKAEFCYREALRVAPGFEASRKALEALRVKPLKKRKAARSRVPA